VKKNFHNTGKEGFRNSVQNITQLISFLVVGGVALAIMIYLLIEDSDIADMPLVPTFLGLGFFGIISAILTLFELELISIILIASGVGVGIFIATFYGFRAMVTQPVEYSRYIGEKAIVQIPIGASTTGRIRLLNPEIPEEFPARSNRAIPKNNEVFIENFTGAVALVIPIPQATGEGGTPTIMCQKCNAAVSIGLPNCPYCGNRIDLKYD
jgi:hypothetical protein